MSYYNAAFDWIFLEAPVWAKVTFVVVLSLIILGVAIGGCVLTDHFNPYLKD